MKSLFSDDVVSLSLLRGRRERCEGGSIKDITNNTQPKKSCNVTCACGECGEEFINFVIIQLLPSLATLPP